jgi:hypothetical protein
VQILLDVLNRYHYLLSLRLKQPNSRQTEYVTSGSNPGKWLVAWLNIERPQDPRYRHLKEERGDKARVSRLISELVQLQHLVNSARDIPTGKRWPPAFSKSLAELEARINKAMRRYRGQQNFLSALYGYKIVPGFTYHAPKATGNEQIAIDCLQDLAKRGLLDRFALCARCGKRWIFKRRMKGRKIDKYCSDRCRAELYEQTPRRKKMKRDKSRENYERQKREDQLWKEKCMELRRRKQ